MKEFQRFDSTGITGVFSVWEALFAMGLSFVLALAISTTYKYTHRGVSYSQSFVQTIIIMGVVVSLVMLIIGSNIARAFSLVGALSIVRFRQAVKDTRDIAFIFFTMAMGMACGTRFYLLAIVSTIFMLGMLHILFVTNYGARKVIEKILRVSLPSSQDYHKLFVSVFDRYTSYAALVSVEPLRTDNLIELVYLVRIRKGVTETDLIDEVKKLNENNKVTILFGQQSIDL